MNYNSGKTFGESGEGRREPKHVEETQTITKWGERWDRQNACGCSEEDRHHAVKPLRELEDSKVPAIFGQRSAILPNGKVSLSSALWYDIFFQLPKFKISPFLGTFIDQRKKNRAK